jgi:hypothetical protein
VGLVERSPAMISGLNFSELTRTARVKAEERGDWVKMEDLFVSAASSDVTHLAVS